MPWPVPPAWGAIDAREPNARLPGVRSKYSSRGLTGTEVNDQPPPGDFNEVSIGLTEALSVGALLFEWRAAWSPAPSRSQSRW